MTAQIVIGLGFGDEGKGITTDYLCSQYPDSIVVRFSGGQQAGHTVVLGEKKHIHSNFCSGTMRGMPSYFSEYCSIYLNTIEREYNILREKGFQPELYVHPLAKLTTPYDVAYNRVLEEILNHGSCGLGIAATMKRHNQTPYKLFAIDLTYPKILRAKLRQISMYYENIVPVDRREKYKEYAQKEAIHFFSCIDSNPVTIANYNILYKHSNVVFEGSQGILLDMNHGVFPNVTYAETTSKNAINICKQIGCFPEIYYVTRCYQTRHGNGWMSNDQDIELINTEHEINVYNRWQGSFRTGEFDYDMINYSLSVDSAYASSRIKKNLVLTCLDQRPGFVLEDSRLNIGFNKILYSASPISDTMLTIHKTTT